MAGGVIKLTPRLLKEHILLDLQYLAIKYITTPQKYGNIYTTLIPWDLIIPYTENNPGQISYLLGQHILINYRSRVFHRDVACGRWYN